MKYSLPQAGRAFYVLGKVKQMDERDFSTKAASIGAEAYLVGGWVRDSLRGAVPKDRDYMLCGCREEDFQRLFPEAVKVGRSFPVYMLDIGGESCEVAFARRERKQGQGYRGFAVEYGPEVTVEEDLFRRDTTMNSMARRLADGSIIDPYGGRADIEARRIRAVSHHFCDDPVRALRAARQAAELGFDITDGTYGYMAKCARELAAEPQERLLEEMKKALAAPRPSIFFRALQRAGLLSSAFPEIAALQGKIQPEAFHPEGDAFEHTLLMADKVASEVTGLTARFAALVHDLGKGTTPMEMLPHHYGHEERGLESLEAWNRRMTLPKDWLKAARFVIREHMRAPLLGKTGKIARLLLDLPKSGLSTREFQAIIRADHGSLPDYLEQADRLIEAMGEVSGKDAPEGLEGKAVGDWLTGQRVRLLQRTLQENRQKKRIEII